MSEPTRKPRKRSYVLNPSTSTQRSQERRAQLNNYAIGLGFKSWDNLATAVLKGKARVILVQTDENSSNSV